MRTSFRWAVLFCLVAMGACLCPGEVLDRIIAIVNKNPILLSDWDEALRCEALLAGRTPESFTSEEQQAVFQRLVDQELLREQMQAYLLPPIADADVQAHLKVVRTQLASTDDEKWRRVLTESGVTESEVLDRLRTQAELERFIDVRFRSGIRIDDRSVNRYYRDEFLPELRKAGGSDVPLESVAGKIREILVQARIEEELTVWLRTLREQTEIRIPNGASPETPKSAEGKTEAKEK